METMLNEGPAIVIDGKEVTLRRLNIADMFRLAKIIAKATDYAGAKIADIFKRKVGKRAVKSGEYEETMEEAEELQSSESSNSLLVGLHLVAALPYCEEEIMAFLGSLVGKKPGEFSKLPPDILFDIIAALDEHEDIKAFFKKAAGLMDRFMVPEPALPEQ